MDETDRKIERKTQNWQETEGETEGRHRGEKFRRWYRGEDSERRRGRETYRETMGKPQRGDDIARRDFLIDGENAEEEKSRGDNQKRNKKEYSKGVR
jgi:hypothetical protein